MPQFSGENLTCVRGERMVFTRLDFQIGPGGALILLGRNGSGKSSLLRLMAGLTPAAAGSLAWDDGPVTEAPERHRERLRYVGHLDAVKPQLSVRENLVPWAALGTGTSHIEGALYAFGLAPFANVAGRLLSAGQRRRLALARLKTSTAKLWLLDEPMVALDRDSVAALIEAIAEHRASGGMAVIATNVDIAIADADTIDLSRFQPTEAEA
ncbi:MAG: heme ABC exporter ATP-binding protein CcmA [Rhodospirillales bacterium]|nr:heme ABC exporter ATP-binding protein CcmA [Rhodospirillales bacterium]